ncbi:MAG: CCA tRNA nucleotidyltransferase [Verrucomicrobiae bacterium]|nr:CCA tRNA nucleotidyltransferase [Verrucomicrobiae bacterium]
MVQSDSKTARELARGIVARLQDAGFEAFWVGGCVRDLQLGREPEDYDIATSARPEQIEALFPRTKAVGRRFGVMLVIEQGREFQVATFRAEADYRDGRRPSRVRFADARADARRRDFTINGLFLDPVAGRLYDWVGGQNDLRARLIRTIGAPEERFAEDHLRMLRAIRLAANLEFEIEPRTLEAIRALAPNIQRVSAERIRDELNRLFLPPPDIGPAVPPPAGDTGAGTPTGRRAARGLELLRQSGLLEVVLPELAATIPCEQPPDYHPEGTVFTHLVLMLKHLPANPPPSLPWAVLLHDIAKPVTATRDPQTGERHFYEHDKVGAEMAARILRRLRFPNKQIEEIVTCVRHHMQFKDAPRMRKATLRRMLLRPTFALELELHRLDCLGSHRRLDIYEFLRAEAEALARQPQIRPPLVKGQDLIKLGMKPGPALGRMLAEIRELQLQEELKTRAEALRWARRRLADTPLAPDATAEVPSNRPNGRS